MQRDLQRPRLDVALDDQRKPERVIIIEVPQAREMFPFRLRKRGLRMILEERVAFEAEALAAGRLVRRRACRLSPRPRVDPGDGATLIE